MVAGSVHDVRGTNPTQNVGKLAVADESLGQRNILNAQYTTSRDTPSEFPFTNTACHVTRCAATIMVAGSVHDVRDARILRLAVLEMAAGVVQLGCAGAAYDAAFTPAGIAMASSGHAARAQHGEQVLAG